MLSYHALVPIGYTIEGGSRRGTGSSECTSQETGTYRTKIEGLVSSSTLIGHDRSSGAERIAQLTQPQSTQRRLASANVPELNRMVPTCLLCSQCALACTKYSRTLGPHLKIPQGREGRDCASLDTASLLPWVCLVSIFLPSSKFHFTFSLFLIPPSPISQFITFHSQWKV